MLDVRRLRLLRELDRRGTIAAVAQALSYTPSAVSQQLVVLEREAGVPLLERTGRSVTLTPAARILIGHTEVILERMAMAAADVEATRGQVVGELRIGAFPTAMRALVTPALIALSRDHPTLRVRLTEIDPASAPEAVRDERLDVALVLEYDCIPTAPDPALAAEPLLDEAVLLASLEPTDLDRQRDASWISGSPGTLCHQATARTCEAAGFVPRVRHHADDFAAVLALVAAGQGVAMVPEIAATTPPAGVVLSKLPTQRRTRLVYRRGTRADPLVRAGCDAVHLAADRYVAGRDTAPVSQR